MNPPVDPLIPAPLARLTACLRAQPPSCGPVRLVAVDGHAGSGKTTFAAGLAEELGGAPVLHLDDLASHESFFGWTGRLTEQVLTPLSRGRSARYAPYDWRRRSFPPDASATLPPESVVLIEGVGAGRRALRPHLACVLWMDVPAEEAWHRGRIRDGPRARCFLDNVDPRRDRAFRGGPLVFTCESHGAPGKPGIRGAHGARGTPLTAPTRHSWLPVGRACAPCGTPTSHPSGHCDKEPLDPEGPQELRFQQAVCRGRLQTRSPRLFPRDRGLRSVRLRSRADSPGISLTVRHRPSPYRSPPVLRASALLHHPSAATISQVRCVGALESGQTRVSRPQFPLGARTFVRRLIRPSGSRCGASPG